MNRGDFLPGPSREPASGRSSVAEPTVFVVDDSPAVRRSLTALVNSAGLAAEAYDSNEAFLAAYDPQRPGCLVLDLRLRKGSGLDLQAELCRRDSTLPIIVMTGYGTVPDSVQALQAGAFDFLQKPVRPQKLVQRIQEAIETDRQRRAGAVARAEVQRRVARLTPREREVMNLLVEGKTSKEVAVQLKLSTRTVEGHRRVVLRKMKVSSAAQLVAAVLATRHP